jgi:hypothetical protein
MAGLCFVGSKWERGGIWDIPGRGFGELILGWSGFGWIGDAAVALPLIARTPFLYYARKI